MSGTNKPLITKIVGGRQESVAVEEVWDSICKTLRICRLLTRPEGGEYEAARLSFLAERMSDLENLEFHYRMNEFSSNIREIFVPGRKHRLRLASVPGLEDDEQGHVAE